MVEFCPTRRGAIYQPYVGPIEEIGIPEPALARRWWLEVF